MSNKIKETRGRPRKGYEIRSITVGARLERFEYEKLVSSAKISGDSVTDAIRIGIRMYVDSIQRHITEQKGDYGNINDE